jgi:hypothetical protein
MQYRELQRKLRAHQNQDIVQTQKSDHIDQKVVILTEL